MKEKEWLLILISLGLSAIRLSLVKSSHSVHKMEQKNALSGFKHFFLASFKRDETEMDFHF